MTMTIITKKTREFEKSAERTKSRRKLWESFDAAVRRVVDRDSRR